MKVIDLRSDTVTLPSPEMREAMYKAELGDDVYDEDPTVNRLQEKGAELFNKEAALFVASGTMGNLISLLAHCNRGDQVILGESSHIFNWEQSGASSLGGISLRPVANVPDGRMELDDIEGAINPDNIHCARTKVICLENTWNGYPIDLQYVAEVRQLADEASLQIHLDGARIWNASVALDASIEELVQNVDSVQVCLSKGLAAPAGSLVLGTVDFINEAKRIRKAVGGAMRQVGILASAGLVAMENMRDRLVEDHQNAALLANSLSEFPEIKVAEAKVRTNMVFFNPASNAACREDLAAKLKEHGVLVGIDPRLGIRAVTHYGITSDDIKQAVSRIKTAIAEWRSIAAVH